MAQAKGKAKGAAAAFGGCEWQVAGVSNVYVTYDRCADNEDIESDTETDYV